MATAEEIPSDLALEIGADLTPDAFLAAARHFFGYVDEVVASVDEGSRIRWRVRVREGSTVLAVEPTNVSAPDRLPFVYEKVRDAADRISSGDLETVHLNDRALGHLKGLSQLAGRGEKAIPIRVWVQRRPIEIGRQIADVIEEEWRADYHDYGTIEGRLEAIQEHGGLQIRIRDLMYPRPIRCVLPEDLLEKALSYFARRVEVTGMIHYRRNGDPISIEANDIDRLPDDADLPTAADVRGILAGDGWRLS